MEMSDSLLPLLKQAFQHADDCCMNLDEVIDRLAQAQEALPEKDTELQASTT